MSAPLSDDEEFDADIARIEELVKQVTSLESLDVPSSHALAQDMGLTAALAGLSAA